MDVLFEKPYTVSLSLIYLILGVYLLALKIEPFLLLIAFLLILSSLFFLCSVLKSKKDFYKIGQYLIFLVFLVFYLIVVLEIPWGYHLAYILSFLMCHQTLNTLLVIEFDER